MAVPKKVSINRKVNGELHLAMRYKSPRASIEKDKKKVIPRKAKYKNAAIYF